MLATVPPFVGGEGPMRTIVRALALVLAAIVLAHAPAVAQQPAPPTGVTQVQLGVRAAGGTYPLALNAANANCDQPLDFRFASNTPWLKLPADPVVRGVQMGETRTLQATIDLTNMSPGKYQATVEVECDNCGWFVFKSCKIDKQQIQFFLDVAPAAAPQPQPPAQADPALRSDKRVPQGLRDKLVAADKAVDDARKQMAECDEKLKKLQAEAAAAKAVADKADADAKEAADKAAAAEDTAKKAAAAKDRAEAEAKGAKAHADKMKGISSDSRDTKEAEAAAKSAEDAAAKAAFESAKAQAAAKAARKAADEAARNTQKPAAAAKAAADALAAKEAHHHDTENKLKEAEAARAAAEEEAKKAIPPPPPAPRELTPQEQRAQAQAELDRCNAERLERLVLQAKALKYLIEVGAIKGEEAKNLAKELKKAIDDANKYITWMPTPAGQAVSKALDLASRGLDIALKLQNLNAKINLTPNAADSTKDNIKKELQDSGQAKDSAEAEKIYKEMKTITDNGLDKAREFWERERSAYDKACGAAKDKLDAANKAAGK